jgi:hypothetical protein
MYYGQLEGLRSSSSIRKLPVEYSDENDGAGSI